MPSSRISIKGIARRSFDDGSSRSGHRIFRFLPECFSTTNYQPPTVLSLWSSRFHLCGRTQAQRDRFHCNQHRDASSDIRILCVLFPSANECGFRYAFLCTGCGSCNSESSSFYESRHDNRKLCHPTIFVKRKTRPQAFQGCTWYTVSFGLQIVVGVGASSRSRTDGLQSHNLAL